jgi:hypothetical protein
MSKLALTLALAVVTVGVNGFAEYREKKMCVDSASQDQSYTCFFPGANTKSPIKGTLEDSCNYFSDETLCPSGIVDYMNKDNWGQCICCDEYPLVATPAPTMGGTAPAGYESQGVYNMVECD